MNSRAAGSRRRALHILLACVTLGALAPAAARAHAVVYPKSSTTGAYERYVLRVPNEKGVATNRIEIRFPAGARVTSFAEVPGWRVEVLVDSAKRIIGAVWTGDLAPQRFVELPFVAANPKEATSLTWAAFQTYADGERVEWTGEEGSRRPASFTVIAAPVAAAVGPAASTGEASSARWVPWAALTLGLVSLGLALRRPAARVA